MNIDLLKAANHWRDQTMKRTTAQPTTTSDCMFFMDVTDEEWDALPRKVQARIRRLYANALTHDTLLAALKDAQLFIHTLLCATPGEATDFLTNNGEEVEHDCRKAIQQAERRTQP